MAILRTIPALLHLTVREDGTTYCWPSEFHARSGGTLEEVYVPLPLTYDQIMTLRRAAEQAARGEGNCGELPDPE